MQKITLASVLVVLLFSLCSCHAINGSSIASEEDMGAYLLTYFKDDTHSLHLALSTNGYIFTAVNNGEPIAGGHTIASQKGIRDPHIIRGPDGVFYVAMTDRTFLGSAWVTGPPNGKGMRSNMIGAIIVVSFCRNHLT